MYRVPFGFDIPSCFQTMHLKNAMRERSQSGTDVVSRIWTVWCLYREWLSCNLLAHSLFLAGFSPFKDRQLHFSSSPICLRFTLKEIRLDNPLRTPLMASPSNLLCVFPPNCLLQTSQSGWMTGFPRRGRLSERGHSIEIMRCHVCLSSAPCAPATTKAAFD